MRFDRPYTTAGIGGDPPDDPYGDRYGDREADDEPRLVHKFAGFVARGGELRVVLTRTFVDRDTRRVVRYEDKTERSATAWDVKLYCFAEYCNRHPRKAPGLIAAAAGL